MTWNLLIDEPGARHEPLCIPLFNATKEQAEDAASTLRCLRNVQVSVIEGRANTKFSSHYAYLRWCAETVQRIKTARIAMNGAAIDDCIRNIDSTLHLSEGEELFP